MKMDKRESEGSGKFLKIKDGESVTGLFRGNVYEFHSKWDNGKNILTSPEEGRPRFRLNFIVKEDGALKAKIWEFPLAVYNQLFSINEEYPLETTKIKITRQGTGTDTSYMIIPLLKEPVGPQAAEEIEGVPLCILEHKEAF
jgi:hypothetical protein